MQELIDISRTDEEVRRIISIATANVAVQGVVLDVHDLWLTLWYLGHTRPAAEVREWTNWLMEWLHYYEPPFAGPRFRWQWLATRFAASESGPFREYASDLGPNIPMDQFTLSASSPNWPGLANMVGMDPEMAPIVIKICLKPSTSPDASSLMEDLASDTFPIVFEVRPRASLSSWTRWLPRPLWRSDEAPISGSKIWCGGNYGTLGGIVEGLRGAHIGITCAHVAEGGKVTSDATGRRIGQVLASTPLERRSSDQLCNEDAVNRAPMHSLDASFIAIDSDEIERRGRARLATSVQSVTRLVARGEIAPRSESYFRGGTSGLQRGQIGGLAAVYEFGRPSADNRGGTDWVCFNNLLELKPIPGRSRKSLESPVEPGDSGAWLLAPAEDGDGWTGMVIGSDRQTGYAVFAEDVADWDKGRHVDLSANRLVFARY